jgi:hypothetical protein
MGDLCATGMIILKMVFITFCSSVLLKYESLDQQWHADLKLCSSKLSGILSTYTSGLIT